MFLVLLAKALARRQKNFKMFLGEAMEPNEKPLDVEEGLFTFSIVGLPKETSKTGPSLPANQLDADKILQQTAQEKLLAVNNSTTPGVETKKANGSAIKKAFLQACSWFSSPKPEKVPKTEEEVEATNKERTVSPVDDVTPETNKTNAHANSTETEKDILTSNNNTKIGASTNATTEDKNADVPLDRNLQETKKSILLRLDVENLDMEGLMEQAGGGKEFEKRFIRALGKSLDLANDRIMVKSLKPETIVHFELLPDLKHPEPTTAAIMKDLSFQVKELRSELHQAPIANLLEQGHAVIEAPQELDPSSNAKTMAHTAVKMGSAAVNLTKKATQQAQDAKDTSEKALKIVGYVNELVEGLGGVDKVKKDRAAKKKK
eukprot:Platyproteum_vivax@DN4279_c0_g1_i1.p1